MGAEQRKGLTLDTASVPDSLGVHGDHDDLNLLQAWVTSQNRYQALVNSSPLEADLNSRDEDALLNFT